MRENAIQNPSVSFMATRFVYAKGLDLMMESFEEFCKQDDEWQLDIIGAGDLWNQIVADAKRRGIEDRVTFCRLYK